MRETRRLSNAEKAHILAYFQPEDRGEVVYLHTVTDDNGVYHIARCRERQIYIPATLESPTAPCPLDAATLWLWLDHVIRAYGADVPVCIDWHGTPAFVGKVKLKTDGAGTHVVVFVPAPEGEDL